MTDKSVNTMLLVLIVATMLAGSWLLGKRKGEIDAANLARSALSSADAQEMIFSLQAQLREKEAELVNANQYTQTVDARTLALQSQLDTLLRERQTDSFELSLYRRIERSEEARAIVVDSLRYRASDPDGLELTLVNWQGRDRVSGDLRLTLNYSQSVPGATLQTAKLTAKDSLWTVELQPLKFDFRFFQKFNVEMDTTINETDAGNNATSAPDSVDVQISTLDKRLKTVDRNIAWSDIVN